MYTQNHTFSIIDLLRIVTLHTRALIITRLLLLFAYFVLNVPIHCTYISITYKVDNYTL